MNERSQQKIEILQRKVKTCRSWHSFCGALGLLAIILVPLSILLGNSTLALCAASWIAGSFFAFLASTVQTERIELEDEICAVEMSHQLQATLSNAARQSVETSFGPISLN